MKAVIKQFAISLNKPIYLCTLREDSTLRVIFQNQKNTGPNYRVLSQVLTNRPRCIYSLLVIVKPIFAILATSKHGLKQVFQNLNRC